MPNTSETESTWCDVSINSLHISSKKNRKILSFRFPGDSGTWTSIKFKFTVGEDEQQVSQHYSSWSVSHEVFMEKQVVFLFFNDMFPCS
jgi:hypothetical protein